MRSKHAERGDNLGRSVRTLVLGIGIGLASLAPPPALAEDDATLTMARERFKEGVQYFDQELYDKARAAFVQAYALRKHPAVLLNLAQSELRSGHEADAATHFAQYLREHTEATEAERQGAQAGLASAKAAVMEVPIEVDAIGAEVFLDQTLQGTTPLPQPLYLAPGRHTIVARKDGREDSVDVEAVAGQSRSITLRPKRGFHPTEAAPPPKKPALAEVEPEPAETSASVDSQGFFSWFASSPVAWIGGGLTVAGVAGGIGFGLGSRNSYDSADSVLLRIRQEAARDGLPDRDGDGRPDTTGLCTNPAAALSQATNIQGGNLAARAADYEKACSRYSDNVDSGDNMKTLATVSWVVAGVAAAGTVVYYFVDSSGSSEQSAQKKRPAAARTRVIPYLSPGERGIAIVGEF